MILEREKAVVLEPQGAGITPTRGRMPFSVSHGPMGTKISLVDRGSSVEVALRRVSDGMAQNAALAVAVALRLGVPVAQIRERLGRWNPAPLRGEWRMEPGRQLYLDCYNANPASMADALQVFGDAVPAGAPRLFVIGCMEELGLESRRYHEELGRSLDLREGDQLVVVGAQAAAVRQGALGAGADPLLVTVADSVAPIADRLAAFKGYIFVKGSRRHELERAFTSAPHAEVAHA